MGVDYKVSTSICTKQIKENILKLDSLSLIETFIPCLIAYFDLTVD